ncbi:type VII secretion-associated protein [Nocardia sp. alder85J]|uniref:type VII secretion-associated protein n=1 Tax=Nocardia sp. alder85J TaxID=2862949 RepID=UPI00225B9F69|nr:type VII secretion-associated protein [Nocardia sp. alder85J]MCX4096234.1 type VII secretion-associated protein [Nocardia sp. alder85J]
MSIVDVVLTDSRLWARGFSASPDDPPSPAETLRDLPKSQRHTMIGRPHGEGRSAHARITDWDGPPSIMPASDGTNFVVGAPLRPPSPAVSVVRMAEAARIAFDPIRAQDNSPIPSWTEAVSEVLAALPANLRLPPPCRRLSVVTPTHWGTRRHRAVEAAARRLTADVVVEPLALRAVSLGASTGPAQRVVVLELDPLTTTATLAGRSGTRTWIEACEHEPAFGTDDLPAARDAAPIAAMLARLPELDRADHVLLVGTTAASIRAAVRTALAGVPGCPVDVRTISGADLLLPGDHPEHRAGGAFSSPRGRGEGRGPVRLGRTPWRNGSLRDHAAALHGPPTRRRWWRVTAAAVALVVIAAAATAIAHHRSAARPVPAAAASQPATAPAPAAASSSATPEPAATNTAAPGRWLSDRVWAEVPTGWHQADAQTGSRVDLVPDNAVRQRITLIQRPLAVGASPGDVADTLAGQIARRPPGTVGELHRDTAFGDHRGLSYEEFPGDGTTVRWQVLIDSGVQVSVGCQYESGSAPPEEACESFVRSVRVGP